MRAVAEEIARLLEAKAVTSELGDAPRRPVLDEFAVAEMARISSMEIESRAPIDFDELDAFFRRWIL